MWVIACKIAKLQKIELVELVELLNCLRFAHPAEAGMCLTFGLRSRAERRAISAKIGPEDPKSRKVKK